MSERKEVRVFQVTMPCPCGGQFVRPHAGTSRMQDMPERFYHRCARCGDVMYYSKIYPYLEYEPIAPKADE